MYTFFARGTGGGGINEQETVGRAPSSMVQSWTLKHLQFLRRDFLFLLLPFPFLSDLNPPKRGTPGVPGVAGVDGISSLLLCSIFQSIIVNLILTRKDHKSKYRRGSSRLLLLLYVRYI